MKDQVIFKVQQLMKASRRAHVLFIKNDDPAALSLTLRLIQKASKLMEVN